MRKHYQAVPFSRVAPAPSLRYAVPFAVTVDPDRMSWGEVARFAVKIFGLVYALGLLF